ncbi:DNA recombinase [Liberibacter crescens]|nr:DNA recombinase [Liberibacter crescens]
MNFKNLGIKFVTVSFEIFILIGIFLLILSLSFIKVMHFVRKEQNKESIQEKDSETRILELIAQFQAEMQGRLSTIIEVFGKRDSEFTQTFSQHLEGLSQRVGSTLVEQTKTTNENLRRLQERLAIIDVAQNNIQNLAKDIVSLQTILSNKQTRGAFGQSRMENIIIDALPIGTYTFQPTLSNGSRPDCTVKMPNNAPTLVIDAKFPLEAWNAMRETGENISKTKFRRDIETHIRDISKKYLIPGETQDIAFMFVPSESIFAEIHENFEKLIQTAYRARVIIVSPSILMLSIQVIQILLRDYRMREQASLIQIEVTNLIEDILLMDKQTHKLQEHFVHLQKDISLILTSSEKLIKRASKIESIELSTDNQPHKDTNP